jgi:hypothetical protein
MIICVGGGAVGSLKAFNQLRIDFEEAAKRAADFLSSVFNKISSYIEEKNQDPERINRNEGFKALIDEYQARCIMHLKQYNVSYAMGLYHKARNTC